jgi:hypothetical protein
VEEKGGYLIPALKEKVVADDNSGHKKDQFLC